VHTVYRVVKCDATTVRQIICYVAVAELSTVNINKHDELQLKHSVDLLLCSYNTVQSVLQIQTKYAQVSRPVAKN